MKDLNGNLYLIISNDRNGKIIKEYDLEKSGWVKKFDEFVVIEGMIPYYTANPDQPTKLIKKESYVKRVYSIKAPKCPKCAALIERELIKASDDCARIKTLSLKTGVYVRYFCGSCNQGGDFVTQLADTNAPCYKLISETMISKEEIFQLYLANGINWIRDFSICEMIQDRLGINL
jgi:hypothetical protein